MDHDANHDRGDLTSRRAVLISQGRIQGAVATRSTTRRGWGWVESWTSGIWRVVNAPHSMDEAETGLVANAIREVTDLHAGATGRVGFVIVVA